MRQHPIAITTLRVLLALAMSTIYTHACSMVSCLDNGAELRSTFRIRVTHDDKPLPGVAVEISRDSATDSLKERSLITSNEGTVMVSDLLPGTYWLRAEYMGIGAAYQCFHVSERPSRK